METLYVFFECNGIEIAHFAGEKAGNHRPGALSLLLISNFLAFLGANMLS
jgi:hypothetical protein